MLEQNYPEFAVCEQVLEKGLAVLRMEVTPVQREQLLSYVGLLHKWNQKFNLTAIRTPLEMVGRHLLDSLTLLPYLKGDRLVDVGTGAGLPGIPLSIASPNKNFFLLDSNQKKQIFVSQAIKNLDLKNATPVYSLVEAYQPSQKFSTILTRAFAPLPKIIALTAHLLEDEGVFLAMMGKVSAEQLVLTPGFEVEKVIPLQVPGEKGQRHLAIIRRS